MIVNTESTSLSKERYLYLTMFSVESTFRDWLNNELNKRGWTQSHLAQVAGLSRGTLSNITSGSRGIGQETCNAIARAFQIPPEIVYRAAGLLPPKNDRTQLIEELEDVLRKLPPEDQEEILQIARLKLERAGQKEQKQRSRRKQAPARDLINDK